MNEEQKRAHKRLQEILPKRTHFMPMPFGKFPQAIIDQGKKMKEQGKSWREIAQILKVNRMTLAKYCK